MTDVLTDPTSLQNYGNDLKAAANNNPGFPLPAFGNYGGNGQQDALNKAIALQAAYPGLTQQLHLQPVDDLRSYNDYVNANSTIQAFQHEETILGDTTDPLGIDAPAGTMQAVYYNHDIQKGEAAAQGDVLGMMDADLTMTEGGYENFLNTGNPEGILTGTFMGVVGVAVDIAEGIGDLGSDLMSLFSSTDSNLNESLSYAPTEYYNGVDDIIGDNSWYDTMSYDDYFGASFSDAYYGGGGYYYS